MDIKTLGINLAKSTFQLHGVDAESKVVLKKKINRNALLEFVSKLNPRLIGLEACGGAHYWARKFISFGHEVKLMSPQFVKPYVKSNKNDSNDAEAICEAVTRPNMRFVSQKGIQQQDIQALHRIRSRLIGNRTALSNQIRELLAEYGIVLPLQIQNVRNHLPGILEDAENELTDFCRGLFQELYDDLVTLDKRIEDCELKLEGIFKADGRCQRIAKIEGIGLITATALVASVNDAQVFKNGQELAAWLGLVPRQSSTGRREILLGISKRGDRYLRTLLIYGAKSIVCRVKDKEGKRSKWISQLWDRRGMNKACVALANKDAWIV